MNDRPTPAGPLWLTVAAGAVTVALAAASPDDGIAVLGVALGTAVCAAALLALIERRRDLRAARRERYCHERTLAKLDRARDRGMEPPIAARKADL
ncbi:MAG: hypothetical protein ABR616_07740 [Dermatophilaceae bacterium]